MTKTIDQKIVGYGIRREEEIRPEPAPAAPAQPPAPARRPPFKRPRKMVGATYRIKSPHDAHSYYLTINHITIMGEQGERYWPVEIFISSKNVEHVAWVTGFAVALSKGMQASIDDDEGLKGTIRLLKSIPDPRGGYFVPGGRFMPSGMAEFGHVIEEHLIELGVFGAEKMSEEQQELVRQKIAEYKSLQESAASVESEQGDDDASEESLPGAKTCPKCHQKSLIIMDGCETCVSCGHSKCG